jgi:glucose dehydrogenase
MTLQLGWSPLGDDFATTRAYCYFQNIAICGPPQSLPTKMFLPIPIGMSTLGTSLATRSSLLFFAGTQDY